MQFNIFIYMKCEIFYIIVFIITLNISAIGQTGTCEDPYIAVEGSNPSLIFKYFEFQNQTAEPQFVTIGITDLSNSEYLNIYSSCGKLLFENILFHKDDHITYCLGPSEKILLVWVTNNSFNWAISLTPASDEGDSCINSIPAAIGTNVTVKNGGQWHSFTNTLGEAKLFTISSSYATYLFNSCGGDLLDEPYGIHEAVIENGQTLYIYTLDSGSWDLSYLPGNYGTCENPIPAIEGTNYSVRDEEYQYFSYTNTYTYPVVASISYYDGDPEFDESNSAIIYSSCGELLEGYPLSGVYLDVNQTILIQRTPVTQWTLEINSITSGLYCNNAVQANKGINNGHLVKFSIDNNWYYYTNNTNRDQGINIISNEAWQSISYRFYNHCNESSFFSWGLGLAQYNYPPNYILNPLDTIYLRFTNDNYNDPGIGYNTEYQFDLLVKDLDPGSGYSCEDPKPVENGDNYTRDYGEEKWYTYTNNTDEDRTVKIITDIPSRNPFILYDCPDLNEVWNYKYLHNRLSGDSLSVKAYQTILIYWPEVLENWIFSDGITTGIDNAKKEQIIVYPTISDGIYCFEEKVQNVAVYNSVGEIILETENTDKLDLSYSEPGMYLLYINTGNSGNAVRVIKK